MYLLTPRLQAGAMQYNTARRLALASKFAELDSVDSVSRHYDTSPNKKALSAVRNYQHSKAYLHSFSVWQLLNTSKHRVRYELGEPRPLVETVAWEVGTINKVRSLGHKHTATGWNTFLYCMGLRGVRRQNQTRKIWWIKAICLYLLVSVKRGIHCVLISDTITEAWFDLCCTQDAQQGDWCTGNAICRCNIWISAGLLDIVKFFLVLLIPFRRGCWLTPSLSMFPCHLTA